MTHIKKHWLGLFVALAVGLLIGFLFSGKVGAEEIRVKKYGNYNHVGGDWFYDVQTHEYVKFGSQKLDCPYRHMIVPESEADKWYDEGWEPFSAIWKHADTWNPIKFIYIRKRVCPNE